MRLTLNLNDHTLAGIEITRFGITYDLLGWVVFIGPEPIIERVR